MSWFLWNGCKATQQKSVKLLNLQLLFSWHKLTDISPTFLQTEPGSYHSVRQRQRSGILTQSVNQLRHCIRRPLNTILEVYLVGPAISAVCRVLQSARGIGFNGGRLLDDKRRPSVAGRLQELPGHNESWPYFWVASVCLSVTKWNFSGNSSLTHKSELTDKKSTNMPNF